MIMNMVTQNPKQLIFVSLGSLFLLSVMRHIPMPTLVAILVLLVAAYLYYQNLSNSTEKPTTSAINAITKTKPDMPQIDLGLYNMSSQVAFTRSFDKEKYNTIKDTALQLDTLYAHVLGENYPGPYEHALTEFRFLRTKLLQVLYSLTVSTPSHLKKTNLSSEENDTTSIISEATRGYRAKTWDMLCTLHRFCHERVSSIPNHPEVVDTISSDSSPHMMP